ncbi:MAG: hypothetical protein JMDDDDMK_05428 [Acidobacteria bacterium]|nr:hypothetical protein [Acidobacteriota bacterium]
MLAVFHYADNLNVQLHVAGAESESRADRAAVREKLPRCGFVDDRHLLTRSHVGAGEFSARHQRNAQRRERSGADPVLEHLEIGVWNLRRAFGSDVAALVVVGENGNRGDSDRSHAGQRLHRFAQLIAKRDGLLRLVTVQFRREREGDHAVGLHSQINVTQIPQRARHQSGSDQQQHRQRHLRHDQRLAQTRLRQARGSRGGLILERRCRVATSHAPRGQQTADNARRD